MALLGREHLLAALLTLSIVGVATGHAANVRAIDGDTLVMGDQRIRLAGIDAPERRQPCWMHGEPWPCGLAAAAAMAHLIEGRTVVCLPRDTDRWGRIVADCAAGAQDLATAMVAGGWALPWPRYLPEGSPLPAVADAARQARTGIWRGAFVRPWDWRRAH